MYRNSLNKQERLLLLPCEIQSKRLTLHNDRLQRFTNGRVFSYAN